MNTKLDEFKAYIKGKKAAVLGIGISNTPLIKYLHGLGADITAFDKNGEEKLAPMLSQLKGLDLKYSLGEGYLGKLKEGFDLIFRTPGMRYDLPELVEACNNGARLTSEMEVFFDLCPAQIFAVTGSDGKTTTTTIIYNLLKEQGYKCWLGGNIGTPLLDRIDDISSKDKVIVELSSFQLHTMKKSADVAVITNLSPNHLDIHKSVEEYYEAKKNIYKYQTEGRVILNYDNLITRGISKEVKTKAFFFSRLNSLDEGACIRDGKLVLITEGNVKEIVATDEISIPGVHNIENYLAAIAAVEGYVSPETIRKVAINFKGVEHRIELVRELNGVKYYNDSIASSPSRTTAGLNSFNQKVILIAGGKDKGIPYDAIGEVITRKVKTLILIGATAPKIEQALKDEIAKTGEGRDIPVIKCTTYEEVVRTAYECAKPGDIVILSPASTSFDMFRNFEERGNTFKELVNKL